MTKEIRREPFAVPAPDRAVPVEVSAGMRVVRRPIFQARYGQEGGWGKEMIDRIVVAKALGFTAFEIDVSAVQTDLGGEAQKPSGGGFYLTNIFGIVSQPVVDGDEWKAEKQEATTKNLRSGLIITIYALVIE